MRSHDVLSQSVNLLPDSKMQQITRKTFVLLKHQMSALTKLYVYVHK